MSDAFFEGGDKVLGFSYNGPPPIRHEGKVLEIGAPVQAREVNYNPQTRQYEMGDLKTWKDGNPIMSRRVVVQTPLRESEDDDGRRAWFFEQGKEITKTMMAAVQEVRGKGNSMPEVGSDLALTYTSNDPDSFEGKKKLFEAQYWAPVEDPWRTGPVGGGASVPPQQNYQQQPPPPAQQGWGAPPASPSPAPQTAPPPAQQPAAAAPAGDPALVAFLRSRGIDPAGMNEQTMKQVAAYSGYQPPQQGYSDEPPF